MVKELGELTEQEKKNLLKDVDSIDNKVKTLVKDEPSEVSQEDPNYKAETNYYVSDNPVTEDEMENLLKPAESALYSNYNTS